MLIDVTRLVRRAFAGTLPTGVDRVGNAYLEHYSDRAGALVRIAGIWTVFGRCDSRRIFETLLERGPATVRRLSCSLACGIAWPSEPSRDRLLINTGHSGLEHSSYSRQVRRRALLPFYFAHDLIPISHPQYSRVGEAHRHARRVKTMFDTGKALIVNSQATRTAFVDYARDRGLRMPDCLVAPLAPAPMPPPSDQPPLVRNYFVVLGTIEPRKNHALLLDVWRQLVEKHGGTAPMLVVIGQRGWECGQVFDLLERCPTLQGNVLHKSRCTDGELATWLRHARALLFPSFTEGFGMPLVEALGQSVPVIASDLPVFREIAGAIPEYLDPRDGAGWQRAIQDYSEPGGARRHLQIERIRKYSAPTWCEHFELVDHLIDRWQHSPEPLKARSGWMYVPRH